MRRSRVAAPTAAPQVGDETRGWANGKTLVFDTSFIHETFNEADQARGPDLARFPPQTQLLGRPRRACASGS